VAGYEKVNVIFADGTEAVAAVVGAEAENDIAVLEPETLPEVVTPATLGNPGALRIGDEAYVVGAPLALAGSISAGVISGLNRTYTMPGSNTELERLIQVDAAVNSGASGGPLLNRNGEVVGIVVALINPTQAETFIGIGLAVRIDTAGGAAGLPLQ
jgi:S1-C subfamily serine protease